MEYLLEQRKPNDFTMSANNPSKRPLSSESEDDRHDRSEGEENEGGMTSALASALDEAEADARNRRANLESNPNGTGTVPKRQGPVMHSPPSTRHPSLDKQASDPRSREGEDRSQGAVENLGGRLGGGQRGTEDQSGGEREPAKRVLPGLLPAGQVEGRRLLEQLNLDAMSLNPNYVPLGSNRQRQGGWANNPSGSNQQRQEEWGGSRANVPNVHPDLFRRPSQGRRSRPGSPSDMGQRSRSPPRRDERREPPRQGPDNPQATFGFQHDDVIRLFEAFHRIQGNQGGGGGKGATLESMSDTTPQAWMEHSRHFQDVARTKNWTTRQMKTHLKASFRSNAADVISDIDFAYDDDTVPIETILDRLTGQFQAGKGTVRALEEFFQARQKSDEGHNAFCGRLKEIHRRAFPTMLHHVRPTHNLLIMGFVKGIYNSKVRDYLAPQEIKDINDALCKANAAEHGFAVAGSNRINQLGQGPPRPSSNNNNNSRPPPGSSGTCHLCHKSGHYLKECALFIRAQDLIRSRRPPSGFKPGQAKGGRLPSGPRNGPSHFSKGRGRPPPGPRKPGINALGHSEAQLDPQTPAEESVDAMDSSPLDEPTIDASTTDEPMDPDCVSFGEYDYCAEADRYSPSGASSEVF